MSTVILLYSILVALCCWIMDRWVHGVGVLTVGGKKITQHLGRDRQQLEL